MASKKKSSSKLGRGTVTHYGQPRTAEEAAARRKKISAARKRDNAKRNRAKTTN